MIDRNLKEDDHMSGHQDQNATLQEATRSATIAIKSLARAFGGTYTTNAELDEWQRQSLRASRQRRRHAARGLEQRERAYNIACALILLITIIYLIGGRAP